MSATSSVAPLPSLSSDSSRWSHASQLNKIGFIYNPVSNKGKSFKVFEEEVHPLIDSYFGNGRIYKMLPTEKPGGGFDRAVELTNEGCDMIVACGGDGTIHEVINGIKHAQKIYSNLPQVPVLGIIPLGTSDDFATHIHMVNKKERYNIEQYRRAVEILSRTGRIEDIDLGLVHATCIEEDENRVTHRVLGKQRSEYFLNIASFGISAEIIDSVNKASSLWSKSLYNSYQALAKQFTYKNRKIQFIFSNGPESVRTEVLVNQMTAVGNGSYFGNGMKICPHSSLHDGCFSVTRLNDLNIWNALFILPKLFSGTHGEHHKVSQEMCKTLEASCVEEDADDLVMVEADGEIIGALPAKFTIQEKALRIVLPPDLTQF
jgi:diacylglycerol kinase (ATP)